jgi:hypothetical protein
MFHQWPRQVKGVARRLGERCFAAQKDHTMRTLSVFVFLFGIVSLETTAAQKDKSPQEAAPIIAVLKAIKESDIKAFRNAYCERIREDKDQGDWEKNLKEAQGNLKKLYGDYDLKEFAFSFDGDADKGKVSITHKGNKSVALRVIKEDGEWKVNER